MITTTNLLADSKEAKQLNKHFLMIATISDCPFCELLKEEVIHPMSKLSEYEHLIIREVSSSYDSFTSFDGSYIEGQRFNSLYDIDFYPTVMILDANGTPLEKVVGIPNLDYYWHELDRLLTKHTAITPKRKV